MTDRTVRTLILAAAAIVASGADGRAGDVRLSSNIGGAVTVPVTSYQARPFLTVVRQEHDFSCGSAAIATLLTNHYGEAVDERAVFTQMFERGNQAKIRKEGFSMLDMKRFLETRGYKADGFELPVEKLASEGVPAIVLLSERGYKHFVVVKGVARGRVLVGDPAMGTRAMSMQRFQKLWVNHILFAIYNRRETARFNDPADWHVAPGAPLDQAITRERMLDTLPVRRAGAF